MNSEWISVDERLPTWGYVIAYRPDAPRDNKIATIQYVPHYSPNNGFCGNFKATHWMPLPEPPKVG